MSIRWRFTASLTFVGLLLFGAYAVLTYRAEEHDLRASVDRELRILGRSLETSVAVPSGSGPAAFGPLLLYLGRQDAPAA